MDKMWERSKGFAFVPVFLGAAVVVVSAVVLYFGVQRIQDLRTVLERPKASEGSCTGTLTHWYVDNKSDCTKPRWSDPCNAPCFWDPPSCQSSANTCWCPADPNVYKPFDCSTLTDENTCNAKDNGISGYVPAKQERCIWASTSGGCWTNQPIPTNWNESALSWTWNKTYSSTVSYANVYVWTTRDRTGNAYAQALASGSDLNSVKISDFSPALAVNTKYYVKVNPNGYSSPDPSKYQCMDTATAGWSFTTGSGGGGTIPNCTNLTGPTTLTIGQAGTYTASHSSPQGNLGGTIDVGQNGQFLASSWPPVSSGASSLTWTPTTAGTYDVLCRSWNDSVAECRGKANYVDGPPRYACAGPNSNLTVTVTAVSTCVDSQCADTSACVGNICQPVKCPKNPSDCSGYVVSNHECKLTNSPDGTACGTTGSGNTCQNGICTVSVECDTDSKCPDNKKCTNNKCVTPVCSPEPGVCQTAEYKNHACSLKNKNDGTACETDKVCSNGACVASEVNACWGNQGTNGKCYDCNGDGVVNILDFSCFQKHWLENVQ